MTQRSLITQNLDIKSLPKEYQSLINFQTLENPTHLKKTLGFYGVVDDNAWNRPATASKKIFQFYHKDNQSKQHLIQSLKEQQISQMQSQEFNKKMKILNAKNEDKMRFESRVLETNRLQFSSNQMLNIWDDDEDKIQKISVDDLEIKKMLAKKGVKIINRDLLYNEWNNFTYLPKKTVNIIANENIIKKDENAINFIEKKIKTERTFQEVKKHINLLKREKELTNLKNNHLKTFTAEQKIYGKLLPKPPNVDKNPDFPYKFYDKDNFMTLLNQKLEKKELFERLSIPKSTCKEPENNPLDYREFRGLLIGDIDERTATQIDNEYIKKLHQSELLKKNIERIRSSRPQSSQTRRPVTAKSVFGMNYDVMPEQKLREIEILTKTFSDFNHEKLFEDREVIENQINEFDKKVKQYKETHPRIGYSKIVLEEAIDLSTTQGYLKRKALKKTTSENKFMLNLIKERCKENKV